MHIIELSELQFKNYSQLHSKKNFKQSIEYAKLKQYNGYTPHYLGLIDEMNNVHAATLLLSKKINNKPHNPLIISDYSNIDLLLNLLPLISLNFSMISSSVAPLSKIDVAT